MALSTLNLKNIAGTRRDALRFTADISSDRSTPRPCAPPEVQNKPTDVGGAPMGGWVILRSAAVFR
ncbi:MAG: hypothetical protein OIN66_01105 [Candidatus Methanoperedens sp.]|nr:hypothetical protein [Candidatus Methanoperedens sp.]